MGVSVWMRGIAIAPSGSSGPRTASIKPMKHCAYCGNQYPDELEFCPVDREPLKPVGNAIAVPPETDNPVTDAMVAERERQFWQAMNFKSFAALLIRIQALWFLVFALENATYLPRYFARLANAPSHTNLAREAGFDLFWLILRMMVYVGSALGAIQYAESILGWLTRNWVAHQPPEGSSSANVAAQLAHSDEGHRDQ
jgi:hypothetical protein